MKHLQYLITALLSILAASCSGQTTEASERTDAAEVEEEVREAWDALRTYAYDRREDLERRLAEKVSEWDREVDHLADEAEDLVGEAKDDLETRIDRLERSREELTAEVERLEASGEEAWSEVRDGVVDSMESMDQALGDAWAAFRQG